MSNEKLAEALRAFPEDPNPFTYRRCYAKAQEALQAHAAEAAQATGGHSSTVEHRASNANVAGSSPAARSNESAQIGADPALSVGGCESVDRNKQMQAAQPVGVPVGWAKEYGRETLVSWSKEAPEHGKGWWPLYTQPPAQPSADAEELDNYRWLKRCTAGQWDALNDSRLHGRLDETVKAARAKEKGE